MANEIDVKDVGDVSTLSDTDKLQVIVNNLLKNIPAKTMYSLLASKIPAATESDNGMFSKADKAFIGNKQIGSKDDYDKVVILLNSVDEHSNSLAYGMMVKLRTVASTASIPIIYGVGFSGTSPLYKTGHILSLGTNIKICSCKYGGKRYMAILDDGSSRGVYILLANLITGADSNSYKVIKYETSAGVVNSEIKNSIEFINSSTMYLNGNAVSAATASAASALTDTILNKEVFTPPPRKFRARVCFTDRYKSKLRLDSS